MSTELQNISDNLIDGIYTVLSGNVTYSGTVIPVYKYLPKPAASDYVYVGGVIELPEGTKDDYQYRGTVHIQTVCDYESVPDKKKIRAISKSVRGLLKPTRSGVFAIGTNTLIEFNLESSTEFIEEGIGTSKIKISELYNFLIE